MPSPFSRGEWKREAWQGRLPCGEIVFLVVVVLAGVAILKACMGQ